MNQPIISDAELLARIEAFTQRFGIKPSAFGRLAIGDGNLITNLRDGRSMTLKNAQRVLDFMATYRPADEPTQAAAA